jgi:hypothetical protein
MEWSLSKMNRIEKAKSGISTNDLRALLQLYGITDLEQTKELLDLARDARRPPWWWRYSDVAPAALLQLIDYESAASAVKQLETMVVPGILQTDEYASVALQAFNPRESGIEHVAALVELCSRRRNLLTSENAPKFSFVLDESLIHRVVGSRIIMKRQLHNLANVAELPNITIQIIPFTAGLHSGIRGPFEVVQFDDTPDENIVYAEGPSGDFISDDPAETQGYLDSFEGITAASLGPTDSISRLRRAADEMI